MKVGVLKSKIHGAVITDCILDYEGSITIDSEILKKAKLHPYEVVDIYNITNGERFTTYIIPGEPGSKEVSLNGAAARKAYPGDRVIIVSYCWVDEDAVRNHKPVVVILDEENEIVSVEERTIKW